MPLLELLWREKWSNQDGPCALVLSPTRELAMQTYDVLKKIGIRHDFSTGLVIGGNQSVEQGSDFKAFLVKRCKAKRHIIKNQLKKRSDAKRRSFFNQKAKRLKAILASF